MRVLLAMDGSEASARAAKLLASLVGADTTVEVLTVLSQSMNPYMGLSDDAERKLAADEAIENDQRGVCQLLRDAGCSVTSWKRFGYPPEEIVDEIAEFGPDLVVVGRRGLHGLARTLGSVSDRVVHRTDVPVLVVP